MDVELGAGQILVAMPLLTDPHFRKTVVLLCEHGEAGALGLVLNRPTDVEIGQLIEGFPDVPGTRTVFQGGPVSQDGLLVLGRSAAKLEGLGVLADTYLIEDLAALQDPARMGPHAAARCYLGYAGWGPGQLEAEMGEGAWGLMAGDSSLVFDADPAGLWRRMLIQHGGPWAVYGTMPDDPSVN